MSDWVIRLIDSTGYAGIFFLMLLETVFPPVPSEVIMTVAGLRAASGPMSLGGVIASGTAGAMAGNLFWYLLARWIGLARFRPFIERYGRWLTMDWCDVEKVEKLFGRFGGGVVMVGRIIPTIRSVVSLPAGMVRMRLHRFLIWSTVGTAVWSALLALGGYILGQSFDRVEEVIGPLSSAVFAIIVLFYLYRQATWHRRHKDADQARG
ncbi:MAG TPA: DedA family protein [Allosphingosinicella sp.]|jgi:membrane protein DedA with SNARE-associated domain